MRVRVLAAVAAVLLFAGLAPAQSYFVPFSTTAAGQAGELLGVPGNLFYPAVKVGGVTAELPRPDGWYGFAQCLSPGAVTAGGYIYSPDGFRFAAVWTKVGGEWGLARFGDLTGGLYFFAFPVRATDDGRMIVAGYTYAGRVEYFAW